LTTRGPAERDRLGMARHRRAFRGRRMLGRVGGYVQSIVSRLGGLARVAELLQPQIGVASLNARPVGLAAMAGWSVRGLLDPSLPASSGSHGYPDSPRAGSR
jgi:hypothetical protein